MNVVDSSAWLEYFAGGPNAAFFSPAIEETPELLVPTLTLVEVFKRILQQREEGRALEAVAAMEQGRGRTVGSDRPAAANGARPRDDDRVLIPPARP